MKTGAARKNAIFGYINFVGAALLTIVTTPLVVGLLGPTTYGTWKALQRVIEVASLLDGKPYQALKSLLASASLNSAPEDLSRTIGSVVVVWLLWVPLLVLLLAIAVSTLGTTIKDVAVTGVSQVQLAGCLLAANALLLGLANIPGAVLIAVNRGYLVSIVTLFSFVLANVGILLAAAHGHGLVAMALITLSSTAFLGLASLIMLRQRIAWWRPRHPSVTQVRSVATYGAWINGWMAVATLLFATEPLMLAFLVGSTSVTTYSLSAFAMQFAASIALMTASATVPTIGAALGARREIEAGKMIGITRELVLTVATVAAGANLIANEMFISVWAGPEHFIGFSGNFCISLAVYQICLLRCEAQILEAGMTIRRVVGLGLASSTVAVILAAAIYFLTQSIPGLLLGLILGRAGMSIAFPLMTNDLKSMNLGFPMRSFLASACMFGLSILIAFYSRGMQHPGLIAVSTVAFIVAAGLIVPSPGTLRRIAGRLPR